MNCNTVFLQWITRRSNSMETNGRAVASPHTHPPLEFCYVVLLSKGKKDSKKNPLPDLRPTWWMCTSPNKTWFFDRLHIRESADRRDGGGRYLLENPDAIQVECAIPFLKQNAMGFSPLPPSGLGFSNAVGVDIRFH